MIYLDNAATTMHKPQTVIDAVTQAMCSLGNAGRGATSGALDAARTIHGCRAKLARLLGCPRADHVCFTPNSTAALNTAICGVVRPGDRVVTTVLEHNSVLRPLNRLAAERGVAVEHAGCDANGLLDYDELERLVTPGTPPQKHDHIDLNFAKTILRFRDPRRFGALLWHAGPDVERHPLLAVLGIEPLSAEFDGDWLYAMTRQRKTPIKPLLMDSHRIVGIGNIYASESLFLAGISPLRAAGSLSRPRCQRLAEAIRATLQNSIAAGGSSVRDYVHSDGGAGSFQLHCAVYDRAGDACPHCQRPIRSLRQAGRSSFYCAHCQR